MAQPTVDLATPLAVVVGGRTAQKLADKLDLHTIGELLRHYPRRYEKRGTPTELGRLQLNEKVSVLATVISVVERRMPPRAKVKVVTKVLVGDGKLTLECAFFNQYGLAKRLQPGLSAMFSGTVRRFHSTLQLSSPTFAVLAGDEAIIDKDLIETFSGLIPVYPLAEGITLALVQKSVQATLVHAPEVADPLPTTVLAARDLTDLQTAIREVHRPSSEQTLEAARARLRYDEALSVQLVLARRREQQRNFPAQPCPPVPDGFLAGFDRALPFPLTRGQLQVGAEIARDMSTIHPMNRLLHGEVGSGKTVVALRAMLQAIDAGRQAVLLAPTEVLAAQHARSLREILGPLGQGGELGAPAQAVRISLITGSMTARARREALLDLLSGQTGIAVGTHALLSEDVFFSQLGLIVVDEQHRFGVEQRNSLRRKHPDGNPPHMLVMTATPIPRTVGMTVYGDLEVSKLVDMPVGRSPISTTVVPLAEKPAWLDRAWQRVHEEVTKGHQVYVVCPKIGDRDDAADGSASRRKGVAQTDEEDGDWTSEDFAKDGPEARRPPLAVLDVAAELAAGPLAGLRIGTMHGRLPAGEKDATMVAFTAGGLDVLVSTTVVEVGVNVPNATMMIVLDAERFGMSQLHQLRGRVGRGSAPGTCLLVTESPAASASMVRLAAVAATNDGFELAESDLQLRREGDVLGKVQAGRASGLKQLSLLEHRDVIEAARADAQAFVADDPELTGWPGLAQMIGDVIAEQDQGYLEMG